MVADSRDFEDLVAIAHAGSLSAAAKRRGVAISTISRRIESLERALNLALIDRRSDGARLTEHGRQLAALAEPVAAQVDRVVQAAAAMVAGARMRPVRITATEFVISDVLAPHLPALTRDGAAFPIHLQSQSDVVSLAARGADLAVRMIRPDGASLFIRKLPELRLGLFASHDYLAGRSPAAIDLGHERFLIYDDSYGRLPELDWFARAGLAGSLAVATGSTRALLVAAEAGCGIAMLPAIFGLRSQRLVELPTPIPMPSRTPYLVVHRDMRQQPEVRIVHRWIVSAFAALMAR